MRNYLKNFLPDWSNTMLGDLVFEKKELFSMKNNVNKVEDSEKIEMLFS
jgi:hypothetical protein